MGIAVDHIYQTFASNVGFASEVAGTVHNVNNYSSIKYTITYKRSTYTGKLKVDNIQFFFVPQYTCQHACLPNQSQLN